MVWDRGGEEGCSKEPSDIHAYYMHTYIDINMDFQDKQGLVKVQGRAGRGLPRTFIKV